MFDSERFKRLRADAGLSQKDLANKAGVSQQLIGQLERAEVLSTKHVYKLAASFGVPPSDLDPDIALTSQLTVPVLGYVGAGSEAHFYADAHDSGDFARMPTHGSSDSVAVEIRGVSLGQAFNGWLAYYDDVRNPPTENMLRELCVIGLEDDRVLVKVLFPGTVQGLFNLHSNNNDPVIENVAIRWAALVKDIARR